MSLTPGNRFNWKRILQLGSGGYSQFVSLETATQKNGAGDGIRTHDVQLGKLAFYH